MRALIYLLLFLTHLSLIGQSLASLPKEADEFYGVDDFNAIYYGVEDALFKRIESKTYRFYDIQLGKITSVDLINPLKVLVFYEDTQTVILLDNRLNELERIDLYQLKPYRYIDKVSLAGERRLWLHNQDENIIELYNYVDMRLIVRTPILKGKVEQILTDYNFCHVLIDNSIVTYNTYGSKTSVIDVLENSNISYDFETMTIWNDDGGKVYRFNREFRFRESGTFTPQQPKVAIKKSFLKAGKLYLWTGFEILTINLKLNKK